MLGLNRKVVFVTGLVALAAVACGGGGNETSSNPSTSSSTGGGGGMGGGGGSGPFQICPEQHVLQSGVIVCDKAFDTAPFVHLPPAGGLNDYYALDCKDFTDRDGNHHPAYQGGLCENT